MKRPCLTCGTPTNTPHCNTHTLPRTTRTIDLYAWRKLRDQLLTQHRAQYGEYCPGLPPHHPPHPTHAGNPLTIDHKIPRSHGGTDHPTNLQILCRKANSTKATNTPTPTPPQPTQPNTPNQ